MLKRHLQSIPLFALIIFLLGGLFYNFSYLLPFTNNAFVVANVTPVAANVSGYITNIYVKNGQYIKAGEPLFKLFQDPFKYNYETTVANYHEGEVHLKELENITAKNKALLNMAKAELAKAKYDYSIKHNPKVVNAVPQQTVKDLSYKIQILKHKVTALTEQLKIDDTQIKQQKSKIQSLKSQMNYAKTNLDFTMIKAQSNGIINNLYVNKGTQVSPNQPIFSFVNTDDMYIQANFNEIDLRNVRSGNQVLIFPRMYLWDKIYHGVIVGNSWGVNRQKTVNRSQLQHVSQTEDNWILLPQRLPVQIKITDYDPIHYPLSMGASTYVYVETH